MLENQPLTVKETPEVKKAFLYKFDFRSKITESWAKFWMVSPTHTTEECDCPYSAALSACRYIDKTNQEQ